MNQLKSQTIALSKYLIIIKKLNDCKFQVDHLKT